MPAARQHLVHNNAPLAPGAALSAAGVADGAMIMLLPAPAAGAGAGAGGAQQQRQGQQQQQQQQQQRPRSDPAVELNADGTAKAPVAFIQALKAQPEQLAALAMSNPSLAKAIRDDDIPKMQVGGRVWGACRWVGVCGGREGGCPASPAC